MTDCVLCVRKEDYHLLCNAINEECTMDRTDKVTTRKGVWESAM